MMIRAIEIADELPDAEIIGTDLSPTQPSWFAIVFSDAKHFSYLAQGSPKCQV